MENLFTSMEKVTYNGVELSVLWRRDRYKMKTDIRIFKDDDGTVNVERDTIIFDYKGVTISDAYDSREHVFVSRVWELCRIMDAHGTSGLTENNIDWEPIKA